MKYKLPEQIIDRAVINIVSRELKKQKMTITPLTKKNLKEIAAISCAIKKGGLPNYLVLKKLTNNLGYGIFLHPKAKPLVKGQIIAPYAGEVSIEPENDPEDSAYAFAPFSRMKLSKEEQQVFDKKARFHPNRLYWLKLDASEKGNFTRFINHSEQPNVEAVLRRIPPNTCGLQPAPIAVIYRVLRTIHPGEQLLVCYEDEEKTYWGALGIKPIPITAKTFQLSGSLRLQTLLQ